MPIAANDDDRPADRSERVIARTLVHTALAVEHLGAGLQHLLEAYGVSSTARDAVADYLKGQLERIEEQELVLIHHARQAQGDGRLAGTLGELMTQVVSRTVTFAEEFENVAASARQTMVAASFSVWAKGLAEAWLPPPPEPTRKVKAPVIEMDRDR